MINLDKTVQNKVSLPTDRETGKMRGFAFVDLDSEVED